jgi:TIR domain
MLLPRVDTLIRDSIDVYLKAQGYRPPRFGQRLLAQSFSGETIQPAKVAAVSAKEIEAVSSGLVTAIKNVVEKVQIDSYEGFQADLLQVFDSEFNQCGDAIRKFGGDTFKRLSANTSTTGWFDARIENARQARHLELKLLTEELSKSDGRSIGSSQISATIVSPKVRIFISHSSTDRELAALLVDLLRSSLNLPAEAIRCTSVEGHRLAGGAETDRALRRDIRDCEGFIGLISATSIESAYVLFELGARWGAERHLLPLLAPTQIPQFSAGRY